MSKLKTALRLLEDPNASLEELANVARDMRMVLVEKSSTLDDKVRNKYGLVLSRLTKIVDEGRANEKQVAFEKKQEKQNYLAKKGIQTHTKTFYEKESKQITPQLIPQKDKERRYLLPSFLPETAIAGQVVWLDYVNMKALKESDGRIFMEDKTELVLTNGIPELWIGDLMVKARKQINSYKKVLHVEPVINLERVGILHPFYKATDYKPLVKGELFWTSMSPIEANNPNEGYMNEKKPVMPSKLTQYLVRPKGFVVFVSEVPEFMLARKNYVYDFVCTSINFSGTSGRGTFVEDAIRRKVTENINEYVELGKR